MGEIFANPLTELAEYVDMKRDMDLGMGPVQVCGVTDSQKVHVMHELSSGAGWKLIITHDDTRAREISAILKSRCGCILPGICSFTAQTFTETC